MAHGVARHDAIYRINGIAMAATHDRSTCQEVYGRCTTVKEAYRARMDLNVKGLRVFGLRAVRADGECWDLSKAKHRADAWAIIEAEDPNWITSGPPCTAFVRHQRFPPLSTHEARGRGQAHQRGNGAPAVCMQTVQAADRQQQIRRPSGS